MRERLPLLLTAGVVLVLLAVASLRRGEGGAPATAEQALDQLLKAAARGDAKAYLDRFDSPLRESLLSAQTETGTAAFAASLQRRSQEMTGWAVTRLPGIEDQSLVRLRLETVFRDRNESQDFEWRRGPRGWRVLSVSAATVSRMPIAYGTPVGAESGTPASGAGGGTP